MDEWVAVVRDLKDSASDAYEIEVICRDILRYVRTKRIRDVGKFMQHLGPEYEALFKTMRSGPLRSLSCLKRILYTEQYKR